MKFGKKDTKVASTPFEPRSKMLLEEARMETWVGVRPEVVHVPYQNLVVSLVSLVACDNRESPTARLKKCLCNVLGGHDVLETIITYKSALDKLHDTKHTME